MRILEILTHSDTLISFSNGHTGEGSILEGYFIVFFDISLWESKFDSLNHHFDTIATIAG